MVVVDIIGLVAWSLVGGIVLLTRRDVDWWVYLMAVGVIISFYLNI